MAQVFQGNILLMINKQGRSSINSARLMLLFTKGNCGSSFQGNILLMINKQGRSFINLARLMLR